MNTPAELVSRVRAALDDHRSLVAKFRDGHDPECECEWDKGAIWVIEAMDAALAHGLGIDTEETP